MIHRQGTGILGMLVQRYIDLDDSERIMDTIRAAGDKPIDLVLHTPGGLVIAAEQIARVLHAHKAGVTVFVPQYAMSGGTLLALASNEIVMDQNAMLGPIDPQLGEHAAAAYLRVMQAKSHDAIGDDTIMLAHMSEMAINQVRATAMQLLRGKMGDVRATELATILTEGRWTHDYPLHVEELQGLGIAVSTDLPVEFWELLGLSSAAQTKVMTVKKSPVQK
jgi:ClpP class serine protease